MLNLSPRCKICAFIVTPGEALVEDRARRFVSEPKRKSQTVRLEGHFSFSPFYCLRDAKQTKQGCISVHVKQAEKVKFSDGN